MNTGNTKAAPQDSGTAMIDLNSSRTPMQCKGTENLGDSKTTPAEIMDKCRAVPTMLEEAISNPDSYKRDTTLDAVVEVLDMIDKARAESANGRACERDADGNISREYASHILGLYNSLVLVPGKSYRKPEAIMTCRGKPMLTRGKLSAIKGQAQSRKTQLCRALAAVALKGPTGDFITATRRLRVLYIDTEQGEDRAALSLDVITAMSGMDNPPLQVDSFVTASRTEQLKCLGVGVATFRPDLAIIDGIADMMFNTNDKEESEMIKDILLKLANRYDCNMCSVIHTNPTKDPSAWQKSRGHIGTELMAKADTELTATAKAGAEFSVVEVSKSRDAKPANFAICVDETTGWPKLLPSVPEEEKKGKGEKQREKALQAVREYLGKHLQAKRSNLVDCVMEATGLGKRQAEDYVSALKDDGKLVQTGTLYTLPHGQDDDEEGQEQWWDK